MKYTALAFAITALLAGCNTSTNDSQAPAAAEQAYEYLVQLSSTAEGIGARPTGTEAETRAAAWIQDHLTGWGYDVQRQPFTYTKNGAGKNSQNLIAELKGKSDKVILIGAHYDSTGDKKGSEGATDNGAGVAALLAVAEELKGQTLPYTVRFAFFGAEENGLNGSKAYAASLDSTAVTKLLAMVNYDTIAGGDIVYVHSAHSDVAEYNCADPSRYSFDPKVRDRLFTLSKQTATPFAIHPSYSGYPEGETGSWSDHAPLCLPGGCRSPTLKRPTSPSTVQMATTATPKVPIPHYGTATTMPPRAPAIVTAKPSGEKSGTPSMTASTRWRNYSQAE